MDINIIKFIGIMLIWALIGIGVLIMERKGSLKTGNCLEHELFILAGVIGVVFLMFT